MDWTPVAVAVITTIPATLTACVAAFVAYHKIKSRMQQDLTEVSEEIEKHARGTKEYIDASMKQLNGLLDTVLESMDYPAWIKLVTENEDGTTRLVMKYVNRAYEQRFKVSRVDYIGNDDYEVWPEEIADRFYSHDMHVIGQQKSVRFLEPVPVDPDDPDGPTQLMEFEKIHINRNGYVGIMGFMRSPMEMPQGTTTPEAA